VRITILSWLRPSAFDSQGNTNVGHWFPVCTSNTPPFSNARSLIGSSAKCITVLVVYLSPVPIVTMVIAYAACRAIPGRLSWRPFLFSIALFLLAFLGLGISLWPYALPYTATAASSRPTLVFVGVGTAVVVPIVLGYLAFAHWVFRGKNADIGYGP
jgi:cytochrome bd-type quinol oxidase subunit 2